MSFYSIRGDIPVTSIPAPALKALHNALSKYCPHVRLEFVNDEKNCLEICASGEVSYEAVDSIDTALKSFIKTYSTGGAPFYSIDGNCPMPFTEYFGPDVLAEQTARRTHLQSQIAELERELAEMPLMTWH